MRGIYGGVWLLFVVLKSGYCRPAWRCVFDACMVPYCLIDCYIVSISKEYLTWEEGISASFGEVFWHGSICYSFSVSHFIA